MKKSITLAMIAACSLVSTNALAQYTPEKGTVSTEVQFNPFGQNRNHFSLDGLKFRYFMTDKDALRINLNLDVNNNTTTDKDVQNNKFDAITNWNTYSSELETKTTETTFRLAVGYERHLLQDGRIDLYAGGELGYEGIFRSGQQTFTSSVDQFVGGTPVITGSSTVSHKVTYENMMPTTTTLPTTTTGGTTAPTVAGRMNESNFFASVFTGIDFYLYKGIYVGTEFGIRFSTGTSPVNGTWKQEYSMTLKTTTGSTVNTQKTDWSYNSETGVRTGVTTNSTSGATPTETKINDAYTVRDHEANSTRLRVYIEPCLRLGWKF